MRKSDGSFFMVDWFFVTDPNASTLDFPTAFYSSKNDENAPFDMGYVGEVPQVKYPPSIAVEPSDLCPECYVGIPEWWLGEWPEDAPNVEMDQDGFAVACRKQHSDWGAYDFGYDSGYDTPETSP